MSSVSALVAGAMASAGIHPSPVHQAIHGTDDPGVIGQQLDQVLMRSLGSRVREGLFHRASVGSVTGVVLDDGREVVVKAFQPRWSRTFLEAVIEVQTTLAEAGLPCARPVVGPQPLGLGLALIETVLPDPGQPSAFGDREMRASARGLARLIAVAPNPPGLLDHPLHQPFDGLYPQPHSPLFDFDATAAGAEWIDELASHALPHRRIGRVVTAHSDWAARNVRLSASGVRAIYDLDSVAVVPLAAALGNAAVTWRSTGEAGDAPAPGVEEIEAWLGAYPEPITDAERRASFAHALWHLAYSSRCEHAVDPAGAVHQRARPTLRREAETFLRRLGAPAGGQAASRGWGG